MNVFIVVGQVANTTTRSLEVSQRTLNTEHPIRLSRSRCLSNVFRTCTKQKGREIRPSLPSGKGGFIVAFLHV